MSSDFNQFNINQHGNAKQTVFVSQMELFQDGLLVYLI